MREMRIWLPLCAAAVISGCSGSDDAAGLPASPSASMEIDAIHARVVTLDTHVDIPFDWASPEVDPFDAEHQVNLRSMREGGLDAGFFIVYVGQTERTPENYAQAEADALIKFGAIHRMTGELYPDLIGLAYTVDEFEQMSAAGRLVAAIGIENGFVIGTDLDLLNTYYELGARYMTLVHNGHNDIGDSAQPRPQLGDAPVEHGGLSEFGYQVIERMNDLGMMVDVSHVSKQTALDAMTASRAPVIASHSSVTALAGHVRNMDDETLLALRDNGGVIQIVAFEAYLLDQPPERQAAIDALMAGLGLTGNPAAVDPTALEDTVRLEFLSGLQAIRAQWPDPAVKDLADHIDYAVNLIGIDHVGISSDFGGGGGIVGWTDALETRNVTAELLARGYSEPDIAKIWSGNLLRVWRAVEQAAAR